MIVGGLEVMLSGDQRTVANPFANDVRRKGFLKFRLSTRTQVMENPRPGDQTGTLYDSGELRPKIPLSITVLGDDEFAPLGGFVKNRFQVR